MLTWPTHTVLTIGFSTSEQVSVPEGEQANVCVGIREGSLERTVEFRLQTSSSTTGMYIVCVSVLKANFSMQLMKMTMKVSM